MAASVTKLCEFEEGFLLMIDIIWVTRNWKLWPIWISMLWYIHKERFSYLKPNQTRWIFPGNRITNEGINLKLERVTKTTLSVGPKCNEKKLRLTQKGELTCPNRAWKAPDWRGRTLLWCLSNELSKSFPAKNCGRGNEKSLWLAKTTKPELQSAEPQSFDCRTVSFGRATVKNLKERRIVPRQWWSHLSYETTWPWFLHYWPPVRARFTKQPQSCATLLIHVIIMIRCVLCLCRIIKLIIRNLYQIIDLVVWFLH